MHLARNITYECFLSQSVFYQVLNALLNEVLIAVIDSVFN